jgi:hypothetical protein
MMKILTQKMLAGQGFATFYSVLFWGRATVF